MESEGEGHPCPEMASKPGQCNTARPYQLPLPDLASIPTTIADQSVWCGYRLTPRPDSDKPSKPPVSPLSGRSVGWSEHPESFCTPAAQALDYARQHGLPGIGLIGWPSIDVDRVCFDSDGHLLPWAADLVEALAQAGCLVEQSPGLKGLHAYALEPVDFGLSRPVNRHGFEVYPAASRQFITFTGLTLAKPKGPVDPEALARIVSSLIEPTAANDDADLDGQPSPVELPIDRDWRARLPRKTWTLIQQGVEPGKRSEAIWSALKDLVRAGAPDGMILSVLTDPANGISDKALERGGGDEERAQDWLRPQLANARQAVGAERAESVEAFAGLGIDSTGGGDPVERAETAESDRARVKGIPIADLGYAVLDPPVLWVEPILPGGAVTLLASHGGTGKSTLALQLLLHLSVGRDWCGLPVRRARCLFVSAEDPGAVVRWRLQRLCRAEGIDPSDLTDLLALDLTEIDAALYARQPDGGRFGPTDLFDGLRTFCREHRIDVVVIDNASDVFDANEIERARVRSFMRSLRRLVHPEGAVLLLAHVDKASAKIGSSGQDYSGSTAWHNSARARLFLESASEGRLLLHHSKANLTAKLPDPLVFTWSDSGLPVWAGHVEVKRGFDEAAARWLLRTIAEYEDRRELIMVGDRSPACAFKALRGQSGYPEHLDRPSKVSDVLRECQRRDLIDIESWGPPSMTKHRWTVTSAGRAFAAANPQGRVDPAGGLDEAA